MYYRALLAAAAVLTCTGDSSVHAPPETVQAFAGGDVILPCSFPVTASGDFPTVEWSKEGLQPNVVFLFRDGCETYEMKNPAFEYRTSLIPRELKNRNISLRISDVQLSDAGTYRCMRVWRNAPRDITTVKLVVGAVSEPKLSFVSPESGGVTLQCEAGCWLREPEVTFLDHQGNKIPADEPKRAQGAGGCYTVTRRLALQEDTKRVTCRVYQPEINQTRTAEILLSVDCMRSCALTVCMAVGGTVVLLLATCASAVFLRKRCGKSVDEYKLPVSRKSSDQGTPASGSVLTGLSSPGGTPSL
uniref:putative selection and upkeep of intraepithelial T-cells protein 1 homolog isoform X1 n=1 Tax=Semicossyphus pulcher TaxID=241346 RepID=UPI0037E727AD